MLNNFINTANNEGAATNGSVGGDARRSARRWYNRSKSSEEGTEATVAKDECMPWGGALAVGGPELQIVMAAPSKAPASSTDSGRSSAVMMENCCGRKSAYLYF